MKLRSLNICILIILLLLTSGKEIPGADNPKKKTRPWDMGLSLSSYYDNNILKNSDQFIEEFLNNEDPGRFHINRYDDLVMEYDLKFSFSYQFIRNLNSIFSASAGYNSYTYNPIKSWSSFSLSLQQYLSSPASIMISYTHLPDFYVKHYRDDDWVRQLGYTPETFMPFSYAKNDLSTWLQYKLFPETRFRGYFSYMNYFHNEHFTEYDCKNYLYGIRGFHQITRKISADAGYKYVTSNAKGYDEAGETKENSDDGNGSYAEHIISAGLNLQLPSVFNLDNSLGLTGEFSRRDYTAPETDIADRYHAGRYDKYYTLEVSYAVSIMENILITAFFRTVSRDAETSVKINQSFVSSEKDFSQKLFGLSFNYNYEF